MAYTDATSDRIAAISDPEGNATRFNYDPGTLKLTSIQDPQGRVTSFGRSNLGDLTSLTQPDGETMTFVYDGHHMTSKTARGTDTTSYVYAADGTLQSATKPAGETTTITPSLSAPAQYISGALTYAGTYTDAHGVTHNFVTDPQGQIQTDSYTADGVAYTRALVYDSQLDPLATEFLQRTNANLLRPAYTTLNGVPLGLIVHHDSLGRVNQEDGEAQGDHIYQYDANGWLSDVFVGPSDLDQRIVRDSAGHPLRIFDEYIGAPSGREVDFTWGRPDGQPSTLVKHGVTYMLSYDDSGATTRNVASIVDSLGRTASFAYDSSGNVGVASDGATTSAFAYDGNNRMLVAADALSNQTLLGYTQVSCGCSEADEVSSIHTPDLAPGLSWSLAYGAEGRLASVTDPDGHAESYGYEPTGELRAMTDRDGNSTTLTHDSLGRVLTLVDALGRAHARAYTVPVQVNSIPPSSSWVGPRLTSGSASGTSASTDFTAALNAGDSQIGHNLYPPQSYPANVSFYRDATFQLSYIDLWDDGMRLIRHRDRAGETASSTDLANATSSFVDQTLSYSPFTSAPVVESMDSPLPPSGADEGSFDYNAEFDLTDDTGYGPADVTYNYDRDPGGRLTGVHRRWITLASSFFTGPDQTYAYYPDGKLQTYSGPDGTKALVYDTRGLVQSMTVTLGSTVEHWSFDYDTMGRSAHVDYPDGHVRVQQYDDEGRLSSRCYEYGSTQHCYGATYDGAGNPKTMTDPYGGSDSFQYDALNRLTQVIHTVNGVTEHVENYGYNALGAVKTTFDPATMSAVTLDDQRPRLAGGGTADAAVPNTVGGLPVTLDGGGRVTSLNGVTFSYDFLDRVTGTQSTSGGNTVAETYGYDSFLQRVQRQHTETNPATTTSEFYVFDGADLVATVDSGANLKDAYLFAGVDHPLRLSRGGTSYFYEVDLAGNVRRLRDASGADLGGYRYTAFGAAFAADAQTPAVGVDQPLRWKGRWFEEGIAGGAYEVRARWWSPQMGTFLSVDEFAYHDMTSTLWGWGNQNPLKWGDPSGRCPQCVLAAGGALAGGLLAGGYYAFTAPTSLSWGQFASGAASAIAEGALGGAAGALLAGGAVEAAPALVPSVLGGAGENTATAAGGAACGATIHGAERLAERGFTPDEIASALSKDPLTQGDNAQVFIDDLSNGNFNVIVSGPNGIITALNNISPDALARLAVNYGWTE